MALKVFNLLCDNGHAFEGWFGSSADYESQHANGQLSCPVCGSNTVSKALSAPYVASRAAEPARETQQAALPTPAQMQALFIRMAREIAANTEDVGTRFAEEARRIHYKETEERGIRGVTSKEEAAALEDEGINVLPLPFAELLKNPLQ
ncbi:MAG: DUF1178 family protein [Gemmatimonadota bacterium]